VRKGTTLEVAELGLGYPARKDEIRKFRYKSRRVVRVAFMTTDERSFAEVAAMDPGRGRGQLKRGGMAPRMGGRGGPGRPGENWGYEEFERESWNREWNSQEVEKERPYGFNNNSSTSQSGFWEDRPRFVQQRLNPNKGQFEDRERADWGSKN
jgi:hypothetical protein